MTAKLIPQPYPREGNTLLKGVSIDTNQHPELFQTILILKKIIDTCVQNKKNNHFYK